MACTCFGCSLRRAAISLTDSPSRARSAARRRPKPGSGAASACVSCRGASISFIERLTAQCACLVRLWKPASQVVSKFLLSALVAFGPCDTQSQPHDRGIGVRAARQQPVVETGALELSRRKIETREVEFRHRIGSIQLERTLEELFRRLGIFHAQHAE